MQPVAGMMKSTDWRWIEAQIGWAGNDYSVTLDANVRYRVYSSTPGMFVGEPEAVGVEGQKKLYRFEWKNFGEIKIVGLGALHRIRMTIDFGSKGDFCHILISLVEGSMERPKMLFKIPKDWKQGQEIQADVYSPEGTGTEKLDFVWPGTYFFLIWDDALTPYIVSFGTHGGGWKVGISLHAGAPDSPTIRRKRKQR